MPFKTTLPSAAKQERLAERQAETCARKIRYADWDEAGRAGMAVWRENPRPTDANPPLPYPCDVLGEPHYHVGHLRVGGK